VSVDIRSSSLDSSGSGRPEAIVGRKHEDRGVRVRLTVRSDDGAGELRLLIREGDHDVADVLVKLEVEWEIENVTPVQQFRLDRPSGGS